MERELKHNYQAGLSPKEETIQIVYHEGDRLFLEQDLEFSTGKNGEYIGTDPKTKNEFVMEKPTEDSSVYDYPLIVTRTEEIVSNTEKDGAQRIYVKFASPGEMLR